MLLRNKSKRKAKYLQVISNVVTAKSTPFVKGKPTYK